MNKAAVLFVLTVVGCGGSAPTGAQAPTRSSGNAPQKAPPPSMVVCPTEPRDVEPVAAQPKPIQLAASFDALSHLAGVPAAPAECASRLNQDESDSTPTDPTGRAKRMELVPIECADVLGEAWLRGKKEVPGTRGGHAIIGLTLASKLSRMPTNPPAFPAEKDKKKLQEFIKGPLQTWSLQQATTMEGLERVATGLNGYGRAVAALESGAAELRFVDKLRSAPTPTSWDAELKAVYEAALDEALEKRKARGRDAVLIGLGEASRAGLIHDKRVDRAREILAKLYGGSRVDGLDALLLPQEPDHGSDPSMQQLPVVWIEKTDPATMGPALGRGVPEPLRLAFRADKGPAPLRPAYARARLEMGKLYWRRVDFVESCLASDDAFMKALLVALAKGGARDANDVMKVASPAALDLSHTEALDAYDGPLKGYAQYDAALLRSMSPPDGAAASPYLKDVAKRFREAKLEGADKKMADDRAADAEASANAIK